MEKAIELAHFIKEINYDSLPDAVVNKAKELVLDQLGCQIAASTLPWSRLAYEYVRDNKGQIEESTIVNYGLKTTALDAAFANACFGHGFMVDDTDVNGAHLGSIIVPATLAMGERESISGKQFIKAVVVGYEVAARIGAAAPLLVSRGFHPGPVVGPFGAAAAVSILLNFDENLTLNALGIAASSASGIMEYARSGGSVNRLHAGMAAYSGIRASLLAQRGFSGPPTVLEGERGFLRAFSGDSLPGEVTRELGQEYRMLGIGLKPYCCCGTQNAGLDAISNIRAKYKIDPKQIEELTVTCGTTVFKAASTIIEPKDITSAQFSGRFGIALRLLKGGNGFKDYTEENLKDPEISRLAAKIKYKLDENLGKTMGSHNPTRVTIRLVEGTVYEETVYNAKGSAQNPMAEDEVRHKFAEFASSVSPSVNIESIIHTISGLDRLDNICELSELLIAR